MAHFDCWGCNKAFFQASGEPEPWDGHKIACPTCFGTPCPGPTICKACLVEARQTMDALDRLVNGPAPDKYTAWRPV
jgi:hypothetical protein